MQDHVAHAERARHRAHVLSARAAEPDQRALARIDAARHRHLRDRLRHARVRDLDEARGHLLARALAARCAQRGADRFERGVDRRARERKREAVRLHATEREVCVGDRELARVRAPITEWTRSRARALRPDREAEAVEAAQRPAAGCHRVHAQHRRAHTHAADHRLEAAQELAGLEQRDVGRGAAHVEADRAREARARGDRGSRRPRRRPGPRAARSARGIAPRR
jgi:hypothetical protein